MKPLHRTNWFTTLNPRFALLLLAVQVFGLVRCPAPPVDLRRATQTEVNNGVNVNAYVNPSGLAAWTGAGGGAPLSTVTNISQGVSDTTSNLLALQFSLGASGFITLITNGSPAAVIQSAFDKLTNGGLVSIQPGTYSITNTLKITNTMIVEGNGATFSYPASKTNAMVDSGTNYGKPLVIDNLVFDGGNYVDYFSTNFFHLQGRDANPYYNAFWTNRTGLRVEVSGGVLINNCTFKGWSGNGFLGLSTVGGGEYSYPKLIFSHNRCTTNFVSVMLACTAEDTQGYYSNNITGQAALSCEYSFIDDNDIINSFIGLSASPGNCKVQNNDITHDWIALLQTSSDGNPTHGAVCGNSFNHNTAAIWSFQNLGGLYSGNLFGRNGQDFGPGQTNIVYPSGAMSGIHFEQCFRVMFVGNQLTREYLTFTNNTFGVFAHNTYGGVGILGNYGDSNLVWGVDVPTNFDSGMRVYDNTETLGILNDGTMASVLAAASNRPFPGAIPYTLDGTNAAWTTSSTVSAGANIAATPTQNANGSTNFQVAVADPMTLSAATITTLTVSKIITTTNTMGGTVVDFSTSECTTNLAGALSLTGVSNLALGDYNRKLIHCINNSGADRAITIPTGWGQGLNDTFVATNSARKDILVVCQPGVFTNAFQKDIITH